MLTLAPRWSSRGVAAALVLVSLHPATLVAAAPGSEATPPATTAPTLPALPSVPEPEATVVDVDAPYDEVQLRDGGFVRGKLLEVRPGSHATIEGQGPSQRIEWAQVREVRRGRPPDPVETPAPPPLAEPEPASSMGRPRVHITSVRGQPLVLYRLGGEISGYNLSGIIYHPVCHSPCDEVVDASDGASFFVRGDSTMHSRQFSLASDEGDVELEVRAGSRAQFFAGIFVATLGVGLPGGATLLAITDNRSTKIMGGSLVALGAAGLAIGIPLMVLNRTTLKKRQRSSRS